MTSSVPGSRVLPPLVWALLLTSLWMGSGQAQQIPEIAHAAPARTKGWSWKLPPDMAIPDSGKRNNVFTVGESLQFRLDRAAAYEVRDYWGNLVDQGAISTTFTVRPQPPGWYKLYLYGKVVTPEWGDVVGGTTFVIFRKTLGALLRGSGSGLTGAFYGRKDLTELKLTRVDPQINFAWNAGQSPDPSLPGADFSARWTGQVQPKHTGVYTFTTQADDGARLWVNGQLLTDTWAGTKFEASGSLPLKAGQCYDIKMEYNQGSGGAVAKLFWESAEQMREIVPQSQLYPSVAPAGLIRRKPVLVSTRRSQFPELPSKDAQDGVDTPIDEVMRGVTGMGPQRHAVDDAAKPDEAIKRLEREIALDKMFYLPFDPARKRALLIAFPNGTKGKEAGVRQIVAHFKNDVRYWEPRNEPNYGGNGADFARLEMKPFYEAVKSVDASLKVLGPGTVSIGPQLLPWIEDFLKAGGAQWIDGFSFHCYNNVNGDLWLARQSLDTLNALLKRYGADKLEKWQTEQGYMAAVYGAYQPRLQGRWTMLQMMVYEQYGIPKEHNHLWYDKSHGFWDEPMWWENEDGSLNPAAPLMRVWSEECYGTNFVQSYNFGDPGNRLYLGSLFAGSGKRVAAFLSAGSPDGQVALKVHGGKSLHLVSAFGVERNLPVQAGVTLLPVTELPVYIELAAGQSIEVMPTAWGPNLARRPGVTAATSALPETDPQKARDNPVSKVINGELENWYWAQTPTSATWNVQKPKFPLWVEVKFPKPTAVSRVVIYAAPPWQSQGTLRDYEFQYEQNGAWITLQRVEEPAKTWEVFTPNVRTTVDSFFSDRWIFLHQFHPVTTRAVRLLIHAATNGGGATRLVTEAGGQAWDDEVTLREIEVYSH